MERGILPKVREKCNDIRDRFLLAMRNGLMQARMVEMTTHDPRTDAGRDIPTVSTAAAARAFPTADKERYVQDMFAAIAPQYDRLNAILSFQQHKRWRRLAVRLARVSAGDRCLDVCTGTGDFAVDLSAAVGANGKVIGADFCEPMIRKGLEKISRSSGG